MSVLLTPVQSIKQRLARRRQMRMALQMLAVSGVLRPGDSELRYTVPLTRKRLGSDLYSGSAAGTSGARHVSMVRGFWAAGLSLSLGGRKYFGATAGPRPLQAGE